jgi:NitT/TauT family transport system permease protein/sulfonate transport system permease protein
VSETIHSATDGQQPGRAARKMVARVTDVWTVHIFTVLVLAVWIGASMVSPPYLIPDPLAVAKKATLFFTNPYYITQFLISITHVIISVMLGFIVAGLLAVLGLHLPPLRLLISERIYPFLNSFTSIGWTVLAVMWFGSGDVVVYFTITTVLVPFIFVNLREGMMALDQEIGEMAESFTRNQWRQFWLIIFPSLFPFIFAALRIAFGLAWKVTLIVLRSSSATIADLGTYCMSRATTSTPR